MFLILRLYSKKATKCFGLVFVCLFDCCCFVFYTKVLVHWNKKSSVQKKKEKKCSRKFSTKQWWTWNWMMSNFVAVLRWITIFFELLVFLLFDCFFFYCLWLLPFVLPCQSLISHTHTHIHKPFNNTIHVWTNTLTNKCRHFSVSVSQIIIIIIKLNLFFLSRVCWTFFVLLYFLCVFCV